MSSHTLEARTVPRAPLDEARARLERLLAVLARLQTLALVSRAVLAGAAVAAALAALLAAVDLFLVLGPGARRVLRWSPLLAFVGAALRQLWLARGALRPARLALLVEERHPELQHLLPTVLAAADGRLADVLGRRALAALGRIGARGVVRWRVASGAARLLAVILVLSTLLALSPGGAAEALGRWLRPGDALAWSGPSRAGLGGSPASASAPRFERLTIEVTPPAYTRLPAAEFSGDEGVPVLPGSIVRVHGPMPPRAESVRALLVAGAALQVTAADRTWQTAWTFASAQRGIVLEAVAGGVVTARRVVPLLARADRAPAVELLQPDRDLVLAAPRGTLTVRARAIDDFGVAAFQLAWVRSRGSGESFQYEEFTTPWQRLSGPDTTRTGELTLDVATLGLQPGDALHLRAVARDVPGVAAHARGTAADAGGTGVSRTRVVRIARDGELADINTIIGFPLEGEEAPVLSQRMIIIMTEQLLARAASLDAATFRREAEQIAHEQERLRERVGDQIYLRATGATEHVDTAFGGASGREHGGARAGAGEAPPLTQEERTARERALLDAASRATGRGTPEEIAHVHDEAVILAVNRPLMDIYDEMWLAERELRLIQPRTALPHEHRALDLLQALRQGERVYSRAPQRAPPVDVAAARGTGRLVDAAPAARTAAAAVKSAAHASARIDDVAYRFDELDAAAAALELSALAANLLGDAGATHAAGALLARAADHAARGDRGRAADLIAAARRALQPAGAGAAAAAVHTAARPSAGEYLRRRALRPDSVVRPRAGAVRGGAPFAFATLRYESGNWDSAPLVPTNVAHALAQYTDLDVAPEGVVAELSSEALFRHPFVFMTGHLPVRFTDEEARNLRAYVERGGVVFIDDHGHDIDGAFHRTVTAELERIFGAGTLRTLPNDHELYRSFFVFDDGPPNTPHELNGWGDGLVHEHLRAVEIGGRIGVLYSNKDYSSEWNYHHPNKRFLGLDNTRFAVNIIIYALTR